MKSAHLILKKNGEVFLHSQSLTNVGLWIPSTPYLKLFWQQLNPNEKVKAIQNVLKNSIRGIEMPNPIKEVGKELLESYGFSTWSKLYKNSKLCYIDTDDNEYIFTPSIYHSGDSGHEGIKVGIEKIAVEANDEEIIETLERVIEKSF